MTAVQVDLDEAAVARLRERAARTGVSVEQLARDAVMHLLDQDPFEFIGAGSSSRLRGRDVDTLLAEGFGRDE